MIPPCRAKFLIETKDLPKDLQTSLSKVTEFEDQVLTAMVQHYPDKTKVEVLEDYSKSKINQFGNYIGTRGKNGVHSVNEVFRGSSFVAISKGGVMVIVASELELPEGCGDELRFETSEEGKDFISGLKVSPNPNFPF
jgi:hypothetical protein